MNRFIVLLMLIALAVPASAQQASTTASTGSSVASSSLINPPAFQIGDVLVYHGYRSIDDAKVGKNQTWNNRMEVAEVRPNGDTLFVINGKKDEHSRLYNRDGNLLEGKNPGAQAQRFTPSLEENFYPLKIGEERDVKSVYNPRDPDANRQSFDCSGKSRVAGWETVQVPAGTFQALKIEVSGRCLVFPAGWESSYRLVKWLAPEAKMRPVLSQEKRMWAGGSSEQVYSLSIVKVSH